jgi:hypothetical protein
MAFESAREWVQLGQENEGLRVWCGSNCRFVRKSDACKQVKYVTSANGCHNWSENFPTDPEQTKVKLR